MCALCYSWNGRTTIGASGPSSRAAGLLEPRRRLGVRVARRGRRSARVRACRGWIRLSARLVHCLIFTVLTSRWTPPLPGITAVDVSLSLCLCLQLRAPEWMEGDDFNTEAVMNICGECHHSSVTTPDFSHKGDLSPPHPSPTHTHPPPLSAVHVSSE